MPLKEIGTIVSKLKAFSTTSVEFNAGLKDLKNMPKWAQKAVVSSRALSAEQRAAAAAAAGLAAGACRLHEIFRGLPSSQLRRLFLTHFRYDTPCISALTRLILLPVH